MSKAKLRRRLLALRREDQRVAGLTTWSALPPISPALHNLACRVPSRRQWWPVIREAVVLVDEIDAWREGGA